MNATDVVRPVIEALNELGAPYMVVGSVALNFYCVPRATQDADIVIQTQLIDFGRKLERHLESLRKEPQIGFESVTATRKLLLRTEQHDFHIELFELSDDDHDQERFSRRVKVEMLGTRAWIAAPEDLLVTKLRWSTHAGREKDVADVRSLISVQNEFLDWPYVESWCDRHGTRELMERLRRECEER